MNEKHTEYKILTYSWTLYEVQFGTQMGSGEFETKALATYESLEAFEAGDEPIDVYHTSAYMKSRKQAKSQLDTWRGQLGSDSWGEWRGEFSENERSCPLLVGGEEAFRLYLVYTLR